MAAAALLLLLTASSPGGAVPGPIAGSMITIPRLPPTPTGLMAVAIGPTVVQLTWAGPGENGGFFTIWRKSSPGTADFVPIATAAGGGAGYTDPTTDPNTRYLYRVRAETSYYRSDWSSEAPVTTPAPPTGVVVGAVVPTEADAGANTPVMLEFSLPEGYRLDRNPFIVVV